MINTTTAEAQAAERKKQRNRAARQRANQRARLVGGVMDLEGFVKTAYDAQSGIASQKVGGGRGWRDLPAYPTATVLLRHAERKQSIAVTWGPRATIRVIDADAHGRADRMDALPALWEVIQALHFGREILLPELVNGRIPDGVTIDGVIVTSPNGLHYLERTMPPLDSTDRLRDDTARILACFRQCGVVVRPGRIEVLPGTNGQSRLPLGHGCSFVYPDHGDVDLETGLRILNAVPRVRRDFPDVTMQTTRVVTIDEGGGLSHEGTYTDEDATLAACRQDELDEVLPPSSSAYALVPRNEHFDEAKIKHRRIRRGELVSTHTPRVVTIDEGGGLSHEGTYTNAKGTRGVGEGKSEFVERIERVIRDGATRGDRNRQIWEVCIYFRLTRGFDGEETIERVMRWIDVAPHESRDLASMSPAKRASVLRSVLAHVKKIEAGIVSGRFYQFGNGSSRSNNSTDVETGGRMNDPLLLNPSSAEELAAFTLAGSEFLIGPTGESLLGMMPEWIQNSLPSLVGAVLHWSRDGRIAIPTATVSEYARTKKSKVDPMDGKTKPAYMILVSLLEHFGVVAGILHKAHKAQRLAAIYETNTAAKDEHASAIDEETNREIGSCEATPRVESSTEEETNGAPTTDGTHEGSSRQPNASRAGSPRSTHRAERTDVRGPDERQFRDASIVARDACQRDRAA